MQSTERTSKRTRTSRRARCARPGVGAPGYTAAVRWVVASLAWIAIIALAGPHLCAAPVAPALNRFVRDGVSVELILTPASSSGDSQVALAGDAAHVRFTITDTTTGQPVTRLHPAAWLSRRDPGNAARPRTCAQKVQELLGGSIFSMAELDLNTFQVIALNDDATITVVDPLFGFGGTKLLALIALPGVGADWALSLDRKQLFVALPTAGKIAVVDTAQWKVSRLLDVGGSPNRLVVQPDGHYLWAALTGNSAGAADDQLNVISTDEAKAVTQIPLHRGPHEIVFSSDSRWAFVTSAADQNLLVVDVRDLEKTKDVPLGCRPIAAAYSKASAAVYLLDAVEGTILAFDAVKHEIVGRIPVEPGVSELKFSPDERFGFVANPARDSVEIIDTASNRIIQRAKIEGGPEQIGFSSDMAYVLCRRSASVGMIPLKEIGREGQPVPVAQFVGGEASFGARRSRADALVSAPGESAVVVANAADKAVYYYMQGMAAPMGNFSNYGRAPCAVMVVDRSLSEVRPGVYETAVDLPAAGDYDAVFFLDSPRITHCFDLTVQPNPKRKFPDKSVAQLEPVRPQEVRLVAHQRARVSFFLHPAEGEKTPVALPDELSVRTLLAPGSWHALHAAKLAQDGIYTIEFTPPEPGVYYFSAGPNSLGLKLSTAPFLILQASDAPLVTLP